MYTNFIVLRIYAEALDRNEQHVSCVTK